MKRLRFPRLSTPPRELLRIERLLWVTYNKLVREKNFFPFKYDVYHTKRGDGAKRHFIILADTLAKEHIDPSLYLKVLAKYGRYAHSRYLPPIGWMAGPKGMAVFNWLVDSERRKFVKIKDWEQHLNDPGIENSGHIKRAVKESGIQVQEVMDVFNLKIGEAAMLLADRLSPWFLAICPSFLREGGADLLGDKEYEMLQKCLRHLLNDKRAFREALHEFGKL